MDQSRKTDRNSISREELVAAGIRAELADEILKLSTATLEQLHQLLDANLKRTNDLSSRSEEITNRSIELINKYRGLPEIFGDIVKKNLDQVQKTYDLIFHFMTGAHMVGNSGGNSDVINLNDADDVINLNDADNIPWKFTARLYLQHGEREEADEISLALEGFIDALGYEKASDGTLIRGSWFKEFVAKMKYNISRDEVRDRAKIAEDLLFGHASIDVDAKISNMVVDLVKALDSRSSCAAIDSGLFLFLKIPDEDGNFQILAKRLTVKDRSILNDDPTLIRDPIRILDKLKDARTIPQQRLEDIRSRAISKKSNTFGRSAGTV